jgi:hypothetical protein
MTFALARFRRYFPAASVLSYWSTLLTVTAQNRPAFESSRVAVVWSRCGLKGANRAAFRSPPRAALSRAQPEGQRSSRLGSTEASVLAADAARCRAGVVSCGLRAE